ncbi:response regulator transcription factor [Breznakia pachnodae]|uniref:DNA-binding response OmpR family regulator n=1 Tax=Breznakia pachnodae TaxID=265178 RepID=A0ABU0DYF3_9FIRM|nr:response regulator transcription factor [Breznakia pachnodae]MDQ0359658.1 DNA-binding response OmpR family regulator [Breznakia pachnodae]
MRLLIIEDEKSLADSLAQILQKNNYTVDVFYDGESGEEQALFGIHDLIILDIMLPKKDGISVLKSIRANGLEMPVILLTAKGEVEDRVRGLDDGADDYLPKPFETNELLARIRANLRRRNTTLEDSNRLVYGDLTLDKQNLLLSAKDHQVNLTFKEAELMEFFMLQKETVSTKELLIDKIWGFDSDANFNHVEVYISFLRKKLLFLKSNITIFTVRGIGYRLKEKEDV